MTRDDIIRMAREAGAFPELSETPEKDIVFLRRFAALVAERDTALLRQALDAFEWNMNTDLDNIPACEQWVKMLKQNIAALRERLGQKT